jgi:hypothetical protein
MVDQRNRWKHRNTPREQDQQCNMYLENILNQWVDTLPNIGESKFSEWKGWHMSWIMPLDFISVDIRHGDLGSTKRTKLVVCCGWDWILKWNSNWLRLRQILPPIHFNWIWLNCYFNFIFRILSSW